MAKGLLRNNSSRVMLGLAYGWLMLPFMLFALGWLRWVFALPLAALVGWCFVLLIKHAPPLWVPDVNKSSLIRLGVVVVMVFLWVYYSGIGRYSYQNDDHLVRNVIFNILVKEPWPVVNLAPPSEYFGGPVAFSYYFGFWLPAALVGKVFGLAAGNFAQYLWAVAGVLLVFWLILAASVKKMAIWPLLLFIFFSGMDLVGASLMKGELVNVITATPHIDNWPDYFQFSSFTTQLYWVFNQALAGWMATLLLYLQKSNRALALIVGVTLISSTLPMIGAVPLCIYFALRNGKAVLGEKSLQKNWPLLLKDVMTPENFTGLGAAIISYMFLGSNNAGQRYSTLFHIFGQLWPLYLLFVAVEAVVFYLLLFKYEKKNPFYWLTLVYLLAIPWFQVGGKADLCHRSSIPALMLLYLMVVMALERSWREKSRVLFAALAAVLIIGSATAFTEIVRSVAVTRYYRQMGMPVAEVEWDPMEVSWRDNFYAYMDGKPFFKLLMRQPSGE